MNLPKNSSYNAYTLLELLIVLLVFVVISAIGISGFLGFRDTVMLNEDINTFKQRVVLAQRSALFLERSASERWIYGIGIDFTQLTSTGKYTVFKWCSQFNEYGDIRTRSELPNFDPSSVLSQLNGNLGVSNDYISSRCSLDQFSNEIVRLDFSMDDSFGGNFTANIVNNNLPGGKPEYLLFESVSGRAFFYDQNGNLLNYSAQGVMSANPIDLVIEVSSKNGKSKKTITIFNISGKAKVENKSM